MVLRDQREDWRALCVMHVDVLFRRDAETHGNVGGAVAYPLRGFGRPIHIELKMRRRPGLQEVHEHLWQEIPGDPFGTRYTDRGATIRRQAANLLGHPILLHQAAVRMRSQEASRLT